MDNRDLDEDLDRHLNLNSSSAQPEDIRQALEAETQKTVTLLATLDDTVLKNNALTRDLESLEAHVRDADLLYQAKLLEKDLKLTQSEADLAAVQLNRKALEHEVRESAALRESVKTLTDWHADLTAQLLLCESQLKHKQVILERSEASRADLENLSSELRSLCVVLEDSQLVSGHLIDAFVALEKVLKGHNEELRQEVSALREVLRESVSKLTSEKAELAQQLAATTNAHKALENRMKELEPQILSKWDVVFGERRATGVPSSTTWELCVSMHQQMRRLSVEYEVASKSLSACWEVEGSRGAAAVLSAFRILNELSLIQKLLILPAILAEYIFKDDMRDWTEILRENRMTLRKDKSPIQWVMQATKDFSDMLFWVEELCTWATEYSFPVEHLMELDVSLVDNGPIQSLGSLLGPAVNSVTLVVEACMAERLSEAISTRSCAVVSIAIKRFLDEKGRTLEDFPNRNSMSAGFMRLLSIRILAYHFSLCTNEEVFQDSDPQLEDVIKMNVDTIYQALVRREAFDWVYLRSDKDGDISLKIAAEQAVNATFRRMARCLRGLEVLNSAEDLTEHWSITHLTIARDALPTPTNAALRERTIESLSGAVSDLYRSLSTVGVAEETLLSVDTLRFAQKHPTATRGGSMDGDATAAHFGTLDRRQSVKEPSSLKEELAITTLRLEQLKRKEAEFVAAEEIKMKLNSQLADESARASSLQSENKRLKTELEKWKAMHAIAEREAREALDTRMNRVLAPPSIAALELLKVKAAAARMERELQDITMRTAAQEWHRLETEYQLPQLDQPKRLIAENEVADILKLRRDIVMQSTKNAGLECLAEALDKNLPIKRAIPGVLAKLANKQVANHRGMQALKVRLRELSTREGRAKGSVFPAINPVTRSVQGLELLLKIPNAATEDLGRMFATRRDVQELIGALF